MPCDLICRKCEYTITIGSFDYNMLQYGYGGRTAFVCKGCGTTHYVEHAFDEDKYDRYLYHHLKHVIDEDDMSTPQDEPTASADRFTSFADFVCPVCHQVGSVICEEDLDSGDLDCPICGKQFEYLMPWIT